MELFLTSSDLEKQYSSDAVAQKRLQRTCLRGMSFWFSKEIYRWGDDDDDDDSRSFKEENQSNTVLLTCHEFDCFHKVNGTSRKEEHIIKKDWS